MTHRVLIHAGLSKCGSTSIQQQLGRDDGWLSLNGVSLLRSLLRSQGGDESPSVSVTPTRGREGGSPSLATFYEYYKQQRRLGRGSEALAALHRAIAESALDSATTVLSAEGFETSLCLRDPVFEAFLAEVSQDHDVQVVLYMPPCARHVAGSWQEWGWHESYKLSSWLDLYNEPLEPEDFWSGKRQDYWGNLFSLGDWIPFWGGRIPSLTVVTQASIPDGDVVRHFYTSVLGLAPSEWLPRHNQSWPSWALPYLLPLAPLFERDYGRFDRFRKAFYSVTPEMLDVPNLTRDSLFASVQRRLSTSVVAGLDVPTFGVASSDLLLPHATPGEPEDVPLDRFCESETRDLVAVQQYLLRKLVP